ncbi:MAG: hypothetical protein Q8L40_11910 [Burkholderiales bacterium]|nr:hypothetical protein [Burkholderiales bacterium]
MLAAGVKNEGGPFVREQASLLSSLSPKHRLILFNTRLTGTAIHSAAGTFKQV